MTSGDNVGKIIDDKYQLLRLLGEGGMGVVYLGRHQLIGRQVAVKFLHGSLCENEEAVKRFYREAQAAAAIRHKNIIDVLDVGVTPDGEPYLVMEFLEGEGLADMLERRGHITLDEACGIMEPTLLALFAAHENLVVHRDLKPDNIFLEHLNDDNPVVKLIDFGISKFTAMDNQTKLTQDGSLLGTPAYMSPEQARGSLEVDHLSDIYAMGVIFYEMLAGETPFTGQQYNELLFNILTTEARHPSEVNPDFPAEAWPIIQKAISKEPSERYTSASQMLEAIRSLGNPDQRRRGLTQLGKAIQKSSFAGGDLGSNVNPLGNTEVAAELLHKAKRSARYQKFDKLIAEAKSRLTGPKKRFYQGGLGLAGLLILVSLFVGICSDDSNAVIITIQGAPSKAKIYYEDSLVPVNPFKVKQGETLSPVRVEAPGYRMLKLSVVPSEDQVINVDMKPKGKNAPKSTAQINKPEPTEKKQATKKEATTKEKAAKPASTKKKKKKNPFGIKKSDLPWNK